MNITFLTGISTGVAAASSFYIFVILVWYEDIYPRRHYLKGREQTWTKKS